MSKYFTDPTRTDTTEHVCDGCKNTFMRFQMVLDLREGDNGEDESALVCYDCMAYFRRSGQIEP